ncbi:MAG: DNA-protecting protein DprA [Patescibacteria group bacterium]|nr:DNA-protecting protein DprA [Patescibacteria group bacterium]
MRNKEYSWYMLSNAPGFGAKSIHYIYKNLQANNMSINDLFDIEENELSKLFPEIGHGRFSKANFSCFLQLNADEELYRRFEKLKSDGITIIALDNDRYPKSVLQNMADEAPPILYCKGYLPLLNQKGVSIVGARDVGDFEITITKSIARKLAENGINVISGYAKGVDTAAHLGALEAHGTTTMILSFGINHITIKRELRVLNWENNALFVTQFPPDEKFSGSNAMIRNKLVCAMSKALVVIKSGPEKDSSGKMSGTFNAGKTALEMGIPVFVLSPQFFNPQPQGNIDLIKSGGIEFSNVMDIVKFFEDHPEQEFVTSNAQRKHKQKKKKVKTNKPTKPCQPGLFD